MVLEHDFKKNPELRNSQMTELYFLSPHKQIFEDFDAHVEKVHDGDTITVTMAERDFPFRVRFSNIDTKELSEGGKEAGDFVRNEIEGRDVRVLIDSNNRVGKFGRLLGTILHRGDNINEKLIHLGLAKPFDERDDGKIINPIKTIEALVAWG